jgi:hypothetical protein
MAEELLKAGLSLLGELELLEDSNTVLSFWKYDGSTAGICIIARISILQTPSDVSAS